MTESGDRAAFLNTVRSAINGAPAHRGVRPPPQPQQPVPPVVYAPAPVPIERVTGFVDAVTVLGGVARRVDDDGLVAFVDEALSTVRDAAAGDPVRVVLTGEPECDAVRAALGERDDVEIVSYTDAAAAATADIGITGARAAVALTGSIVVDAGRAGGRTASLLPPLHLAIVNEETIVDEPGDLWRSLGTPMPSNLVQITGPSRSADIELIITLGVHGPKALWVAVVS